MNSDLPFRHAVYNEFRFKIGLDMEEGKPFRTRGEFSRVKFGDPVARLVGNEVERNRSCSDQNSHNPDGYGRPFARTERIFRLAGLYI